MATMRITLTAEEIGLACMAYIARTYNVGVVEVTLSASTATDQMDRPTGGHIISASAECKAAPSRDSGDGKT
jgi:hypothetical protein